MSKYLYVEMINNWDKYIGKDLDLDVPLEKRVVKIEFTEEQIKKLEPKKLGCYSNQDRYEDIRLICIQEE